LLAEFGIDDGAVRTAFSRLASDGWITRKKIGRNAFYSLDETGRLPFANATSQIYEIPVSTATREMGLIVAVAAPAKGDAFAEFVSKNSGFLLSGETAVFEVDKEQISALSEKLQKANLLVLESHLGPIPDWIQDHPVISATARDYTNLMESFSFLPDELSPIEAMAARCLLIHEWRRLILRAPTIPSVLLPIPWPVDECAVYVAELYHKLLPASEEWFNTHEIEASGPLPIVENVSQRFNMLQK